MILGYFVYFVSSLEQVFEEAIYFLNKYTILEGYTVSAVAPILKEILGTILYSFIYFVHTLPPPPPVESKSILHCSVILYFILTATV